MENFTPANENETITPVEAGPLTTNLFKHCPKPVPVDEKLATYLRIRPTESACHPTEQPAFAAVGDVLTCYQPKIGKNGKNSDNRSTNYKFTQIFDGNTSQEKLYKQCTQSVITEFLNGNNCLIFAYGTTSSGKTYTMRGTPSEPGLIVRSLCQIFGVIGRQISVSPVYKPCQFADVMPLDEMEVENILNRPSLSSTLPASVLDSISLNENRSDSDYFYELGFSDPNLSDHCYDVYVTFTELYKDKMTDLLQSGKEGLTMKFQADRNYYRYLHVNLCLDGKESKSTSGSLMTSIKPSVAAASSSTKTSVSILSNSCPVCRKYGDITSAHLKKCAKERGWNANRLVNRLDKRNDKQKLLDDYDFIPQRVNNEKPTSAASDSTKSGNLVKKTGTRVTKKVTKSSNSKDDAFQLAVAMSLSELQHKQMFTEVNGQAERMTNQEKQAMFETKLSDEVLKQDTVTSNYSSLIIDEMPKIWYISSLPDISADNGYSYFVEPLKEFMNQDLFTDDKDGKCETPVKNSRTTDRKDVSMFANNSVVKKLNSCVNNPVNSDVILLCCNDRTVYAHKFMFNLHDINLNTAINRMEVNGKHVIDCKHVNEEDIVNFLTFVYTGVLNVNRQNYETLINIAKLFSFNELKKYVDDFVARNANDFNICTV